MFCTPAEVAINFDWGVRESVDFSDLKFVIDDFAYDAAAGFGAYV